MGKIIIGNHVLSFDQIKKGIWPALSPYFEGALLFCREWLGGKETFDLQTSGSTGIPKKISVNRKQMEISAQATHDFFDIPEYADLLGCLNFEMIAGKMMLVRAMEWNSNIYLVEPSSDPLTSFGPDRKFYFAAMVPLQLSASIENPHSFQKLSNIQNLIIGGAPITMELKDKAADLPINIFQTFGMTETVSHVALAKIKRGEELIYQPLPGVHFSVDDTGKLSISAPMAQEKMLITNDIVKLYPDNSFTWTGRSDFTINSGGIKIHPEEIENIISTHINDTFPLCRFFIFGEKNQNFGEIICLLIEQSDGNDKQVEDLQKKLKVHLSKYLVPKKIYFLKSFEETASGKINRPATLEKLYL
ncbi:MAG TPA: AMP-binding protein [Anditalea sp.]|nr:AMP-binding protein [Anditalea sp.]